MANGLLRELQEVRPPETVVLPSRDVRARRPAGLTLLLRLDIFRRLSRIMLRELGNKGLIPGLTKSSW